MTSTSTSTSLQPVLPQWSYQRSLSWTLLAAVVIMVKIAAIVFVAVISSAVTAVVIAGILITAVVDVIGIVIAILSITVVVFTQLFIEPSSAILVALYYVYHVWITYMLYTLYQCFQIFFDSRHPFSSKVFSGCSFPNHSVINHNKNFRPNIIAWGHGTPVQTLWCTRASRLTLWEPLLYTIVLIKSVGGSCLKNDKDRNRRRRRKMCIQHKILKNNFNNNNIYIII